MNRRSILKSVFAAPLALLASKKAEAEKPPIIVATAWPESGNRVYDNTFISPANLYALDRITVHPTGNASAYCRFTTAPIIVISPFKLSPLNQ